MRQVLSTATGVADEFLKIAKSKETSLTPMQLLKLVYIAHGWALAILDKDLFSDRIEAWKYGPVIPSLYHATKQYGRNTIPMSKVDDVPRSGLDPDAKAFLEDVFEKYGGLDGIQLSNLTHLPGSPWHQVFENHQFGIEIDDERIRNHYLDKLHEHKQRSTA